MGGLHLQGFPGDPAAPLVCLVNGGNIRAGLPPGDVTYGDVTAVLPFGNYIEVLSITGADLKAALAHGFDMVRPNPLLSHSLPQCSTLLEQRKFRDVPSCLAVGFVGVDGNLACTRLARQSRRQTRHWQCRGALRRRAITGH